MLALFLSLTSLVSGLSGNFDTTPSIRNSASVTATSYTQDISGQGGMHWTLITPTITFYDYLSIEGLGGTEFRVSFNDDYTTSQVNINYLLTISVDDYNEQTEIFSNRGSPIPLWDSKRNDGVYIYNFNYEPDFSNHNELSWYFTFTYLDSVTFDATQDTLSYNYVDSNTYQQGYNDGQLVGYQQGLSEGLASDTTIASISSAIMQVGVLPINLFLAVFNYEILGINISGLIGGALTIACLVIALRTIMGTNKGD